MYALKSTLFHLFLEQHQFVTQKKLAQDQHTPIGHVLATVKTQIQIILAEYWCYFTWVENILNPAKNI